jgi:hypothetical protein
MSRCRLAIRDRRGRSVEAAVRVEAATPTLGIYKFLPATAASGKGRYQFDAALLDLPDWWVIRVTITSRSAQDTAIFNLGGGNLFRKSPLTVW